jgi:hypothetical protein
MMAQTFFTIEVYYDHGPEPVRYVMRNMTAQKLKEFREVIINAGLMIPRETDHWIIVLPTQIRSIDVTRQEKFFRNS